MGEIGYDEGEQPDFEYAKKITCSDSGKRWNHWILQEMMYKCMYILKLHLYNTSDTDCEVIRRKNSVVFLTIGNWTDFFPPSDHIEVYAFRCLFIKRLANHPNNSVMTGS